MRRALLALVVVLAVAVPIRLHADAPDYSAFAGPWYHHGQQLTVAADGYVTIQHSDISPMAEQHIQLTSSAYGIAYGQDLETGDAVWLLLLQHDMLAKVYLSGAEALVYCGPESDAADMPDSPSPCGT